MPLRVALRLACSAIGLPGRLLINWIDGRKRASGDAPLGAFLRRCTHGFVWLVALMALLMAAALPTALSPVPVTSQPASVNYEPTDEPTEQDLQDAVQDYLATPAPAPRP